MSRQNQRGSYNRLANGGPSFSEENRVFTILHPESLVDYQSFHPEFLLTGVRAISEIGNDVVIVRLDYWDRFCAALEDVVRRPPPTRSPVKAETKREQKHCISNVDVTSDVVKLTSQVDALLHLERSELKKKNNHICQLKQEVKNVKVKNLDLKNKLQKGQRGLKAFKQMKRVMYSIQRVSSRRRRNKMKDKNEPQCSAVTDTKTNQLKHKTCYCCRGKGHLAKDCSASPRIAFDGTQFGPPLGMRITYQLHNGESFDYEWCGHPSMTEGCPRCLERRKRSRALGSDDFG